MAQDFSQGAFNRLLKRAYLRYTFGFVAFVLGLAVLEQLGLSRTAIGYAFILSTIALYAVIGALCRTTDAAEYYVAGRRVPAIYNGMATGSDWMSAASFIGMDAAVTSYIETVLRKAPDEHMVLDPTTDQLPTIDD